MLPLLRLARIPGVILAALFLPSMLLAQTTLYWDADGSGAAAGGTGTWDTSASRWTSAVPPASGAYQAWVNGTNVAVFPGASSITLGTDITAGHAVVASTEFSLNGHTLTLGGDNTTSSLSGTFLFGAGKFIKVGTGTITMSALNDHTGGTDILNGALLVSSDLALGRNTGTLTLSGGTLQLGGNVTFSNSRSVVVTIAGAIDTAGFNGTVGGVVSGSGALTKAGTGLLTLAAPSTYAGGTTISGGTLALQSTWNSPTFAIAAGAALELDVGVGVTRDSTGPTALFSGAGTLRKTGGGLLQWSSTAATFALGAGSLIDVQGGTLQGGHSANDVWTNNHSSLNVAAGAVFSGVESNIRVDALTGIGTVKSGFSGGAGYTAFTFGVDGGSGTFTGVLADDQGPGSFVKTGAGTQTLSGANTYTGTLSITGGTLTLGASNVMPDTAPLTMNASTTFNLANFTDTIGSLSGAGSVTLGSGTLTVGGNTATTTFSGTISGTGGLVKIGAGALTLSGANNTTGAITVNGGVLTLSGANASTGAVTVNGGTAQFSGSNTTTGPVAVNGGTLQLSGGSALSDTSAVTLANTAGATLAIAGSETIGSLAGGGTAGGNVTLASGATLTTGGTNASTTLASALSGSGSLVKSGTGTFTLSGTNTNTGPTTVAAGTLQLARQVSLYNNTPANWTAGNLTVSPGATLALNVGGAGEFTTANLSTLSALGTATGGFQSGSALALDTTNASGGDFAYGGVLANPNGGTNTLGLTKLGAGTLTLTGANTYTGSTTISAGTLVLGAANVLSDTTALTVGSGAGLVVDFSETIGSLAGTGSIGLNAGTLTIGAANTNATFAGGIGGGGALTKTGTGTLTLSNVNVNYAGPTTIAGGTLEFNIGATSLPSSVALYGTGTLRKSGGGWMLWGDLGQGSKTFALGSGSLIDVQGGILGAGYTPNDVWTNNHSALNVAAGATFASGGSNVRVDALTGAGTIQSGHAAYAPPQFTFGVDGGSGTFAGILADDLGLQSYVKAGGGTQTLSGASTYTGSLTVTAGTLIITGSTTSTAPTTITGGTLQLSGVAGAALPDASAVILANTFGASLAVTTNETIGSLAGGGTSGGNVALSSATLTTGGDNSNAAFAGAISGPGGIAKTGSGVQILSGVNTYTGATVVNAGALQFANPGALYGGNTSLWNTTQLIVNSGGTLGFNIGGPGEFTLGDFNTLANLATATGGFKSGSLIGLDPTNAPGGALTYGSVLANSNGGANVLGLNKLGAGTLTLTGANTYTGGTTVSGGTLVLGAANALPDVTALTVVSGGTINFANFSDTVGSLAGAGNVAMGSGTLTVGDSTSTTFAGVISGTGGLNKTGSGTLTLSGVNTYTGTTMIAGGTLDFNVSSGTRDLPTAVTFAGGGTLKKTGAGTVVWGSSIATFALGAGSLIDVQGGTFQGGSGGNENWTNNHSSLNVAAGAVFSGVESNIRVDVLTGAGTIKSGFSGGAGYTGFMFGVDGGSGTFTGVLADDQGPGSFVKAGGGTQTLSGPTSTYTGVMTIAGGTLALGANNVVSDSGGISVSSGATFNLANFSDTIGGLTGTGAVALGSGTLAVSGNSTSPTFAGVISGPGNLAKSGTGVQVISGPNTYAGTTTVNAGALQFANPSALYGGNTSQWNTTQLIVNSGGTLGFNIGGTGEFTVANIATLSALGSATGGFKSGSFIGLDPTNAPGGTFTYSSVLSNSNGGTNALGLTKLGAGTLTLTGTNTYTGGTMFTNGTVNVGSPGALGSTGVLTFNGGILQFSAANTADYSTRMSSASNQQFRFDTNGQNVTFANPFGASDSALTKLGAGTLTLAGPQTYAGTTTVAAGVLALNGPNISPSFVIASGATLRLVGNVSPDFLGTITYSGSGTLQSNQANQPNVGQYVFALGTGSLIDVQGGSFGNPDATDVSYNWTNNHASLNVAAGAQFYASDGRANIRVDALTGGGRVLWDNSNFIVGIDGGSGTFSGRLLAPLLGQQFVKAGSGTQTLTGSNDLRGGTTLSGGTLALGSAAALGVNGGTLTFTGGTLQFSAANTVDYSARLSSAPGQQFSFDTNGQNVTFATAFGAAGSTLTKLGDGMLTLSGANLFDGLTTISGGTLRLAGGATLPGTNPIALANTAGATLAIAASTTIGSLSGGGATGGNVTLESAATLTTGGNNAFTTFAGAISGTGGLVKTGLGTFTLSGLNTYTGATTISGGTLGLGATGVLPDATALTVGSGATFNLAGFSGSVGSLAGAGAVTLGSGTLTAGSIGASTTFAGIVSGSGGLAKTGSGTFTLSGANTYTGPTTISAGILALGASGVLSDATALTVGAGATFNLANFSDTVGSLAGSGAVTLGSATLTAGGDNSSTAFAGVISGTGGFTKTGSGTLTLSGANTHSGGTTLSGGTLALGAASALGTGTVTLDGGALRSTGSALTIANALTLTGDTTLSGSSALTFAGPLTLERNRDLTITNSALTLISGAIGESVGGRALSKYGAGTLELTGANTYTGGTFIGAGIVRINNTAGSAFGTGAVTVATGATLAGNGSFTGALQLNGMLSPGSSPGFVAAGSTTFAPGAGFTFELNNANGAAGTNWDLLSITGGLTINATPGGKFTVALNTLNLAGTAGVPANFNAASNYTFSFVTASSGITGFNPSAFALTTIGVDSSLTGTWSIAQLGNNLNLSYTATPVPEPSSYAALAGLGALALAIRRRALRRWVG